MKLDFSEISFGIVTREGAVTEEPYMGAQRNNALLEDLAHRRQEDPGAVIIALLAGRPVKLGPACVKPLAQFTAAKKAEEEALEAVRENARNRAQRLAGGEQAPPA